MYHFHIWLSTLKRSIRLKIIWCVLHHAPMSCDGRLRHLTITPEIYHKYSPDLLVESSYDIK